MNSKNEFVELPRRNLNISVFKGMEREVDLLLHEIFDKNPYTRHGIQIQDGDCIFDLGANMGLFSLWCTQQAKDLHLYACEPIPPLFQLTQKNLTSQQKHTIHIDPRGVGREQGTHNFSFFPRATACSTMHGEDTIKKMPELYSNTDILLSDLWSIHKGAFLFALACGPFFRYIRPLAIRTVLKRALSKEEVFSCSICSLSDLIDEWKPQTIDLLKIDVQGAETDILLGIRDEHWSKIQQIAMEVNSFLGDNLETDIVELLTGKGFSVIRDDSSDIAAPGSYFVYALRK
jgi:FkbM family methyltransferase